MIRETSPLGFGRRAAALCLVLLVASISCEQSDLSPSTDGEAGDIPTRYDSRIGDTRSFHGRLVLLDPLDGDRETPVANLQYRASGEKTDGQGLFVYASGDELLIRLDGGTELAIPSKPVLTQHDIAVALCAADAERSACEYRARKNAERFLLSLDDDGDASNGIRLVAIAGDLDLLWTASIDLFEAVLARQLARHDLRPARLFHPSLGINTEAPQAEADDVAQPMPFVDVFRTARPFAELSCEDVTYDEHGWPRALPSSCSAKSPSGIKTMLLQNVSDKMLPAGRYTVLYEGGGTLAYGGYGALVSRTSGRDIIDVSFDSPLARLDVEVVSGEVRNIRVVMPGGICEGNAFVRLDDASECPAGKFRSFEAMLAANRNAIVFNPDYLRFLKDFRVVRMMNLMEASPSFSACFIPDPNNASGPPVLDEACLLRDFSWQERGKIDDAVWGGSFRTPRLKRYARGAPLEVQVALANTLEVDPWFTIVHNATDDYVRRFATYVSDNLAPGLKAHVEYTNEAWNGNFWAALYVRKKGEGLFTAAVNPFWDGAYYYAKRASEIFEIWEEVFGGTSRLLRILGTYQANVDLTRNMLDYQSTKDRVDAIAMGAYFYACWDRASAACQDTQAVPRPLSEAGSLDDIFAAIDNPDDPYGMSSLQEHIVAQGAIAESYGKALYVYEGGQHLVVPWGDSALSRERKSALHELFKDASRDPRMAQRYLQLLDSWKRAKGALLMLYTLPQSFHRFGIFGIKEHLNQPRSDAPKYDGAMIFQEREVRCWWGGC